MDFLRGLQSPEQAERVASAQRGRHPIVSNGHSQQFSMHIATARRLEGESLLPFIRGGGGPCTAPANINVKAVIRRSVVKNDGTGVYMIRL